MHFFNSTNDHNIVVEERSVIIVGKTGAGKSNLLNKLLLDDNAFRVSPAVESVTTEISSIGKVVEFQIQYLEIFKKKISYNLKCFDTPGLADSKGRSKDFLNQIAKTIQINPFNKIIILVEYNRLDTGLYNNLEVLRECLNDLPDSSAMLIINKVPTEKLLENKRKKGQQVPDREEELRKTHTEIAQALGNTFSNVMFLENDDYEPDINDAKYSELRKIIWSSRLFNAKNVKTWDEILAFYEKDIKELTGQELEIKRQDLISNIEHKLDNIEFEIANVKYPYLEKQENPPGMIEFVEKFECKYSKEEYFEKVSENKDLPYFLDKYGQFKSAGKAVLFIALSPFLIPYILLKKASPIEDDLRKLGEKRTSLNVELNDLKTSLDRLKEKIAQLREKIIRLEAALVNKNQVE